LKIVERVTLHSPSRLKVGISDDTGRITMLENRTFGTQANDNDTAPSLTRYIYSNHLQSASLELNHLAEIISYEEYHPYGTTSYQAINAAIQAVAKRYRYTGKERDEESGLYYHGARYYVPWLCRWVSVDPLESKFAGRTPYCYGGNNPVIFNDPNGKQEKKMISDPAASRTVTTKNDLSPLNFHTPTATAEDMLNLPAMRTNPSVFPAKKVDEKKSKQDIDNSSPDSDGIGLTLDQMKAIFPAVKDKKGNVIKDNTKVLTAVTFYLNKYGKEFGLDDKRVLKHFLAQSGVETGNFQTYNATENMNYSAKRIDEIFGKYFNEKTGRKPVDYAHNESKLANVTYGNRMGNGSEASGDGWKYRGRGALQLTGKGSLSDMKHGYTAFTKFYQDRFNSKEDFVDNPDPIATDPQLSVLSGLWYFKANVNYSKLDNTLNTVPYVTKAVNGGEIGLEERTLLYIKIQAVIGN